MNLWDRVAKMIEDAIARLLRDGIPGNRVTGQLTSGAQGPLPPGGNTGDGYSPGPHDLVGDRHEASGLTTGQPLRATGAAAFAFGPLDLENTDATTGELLVSRGGTGVASADERTAFMGPPNGAGTGAPSFRAIGLTDLPTQVLRHGVADLTAGRVPVVNDTNILTDDADLVFTGTELRLGGTLRLAEQGSAPGTPDSGFGVLYMDADGVPSAKDDAGTVRQMVPYEEGTFTPTYFGTTSAGTTTYSSQVGEYTRNGNRVDITIHLSWSAATGTGNARIGGLPFTARNVTNLFSVPSVLYNGVTYTGNGVQALIRYNTAEIELYNAPASNAGVAALPVEAGGGELLLTATYWI